MQVVAFSFALLRGFSRDTGKASAVAELITAKTERHTSSRAQRGGEMRMVLFYVSRAVGPKPAVSSSPTHSSAASVLGVSQKQRTSQLG